MKYQLTLCLATAVLCSCGSRQPYAGNDQPGQYPVMKAVNNVLLVPQKATYEMQDKKFVFVVDGSNTVKNREIQVMDISSGDSFVVEKGLQAGEKIVTDGTGSLKEGMKIVPGNNAPSTPH